MARTNIPVKTVNADGATGVDMSAGSVAADDPNEMMFANPGGKTLLVVMTSAASGVSITIMSVVDPYNRLGDLGPTAVGASKTHVFGPFSPLLFNQKSGADIDKVYINISAVSGTAVLQALNTI